VANVRVVGPSGAVAESHDLDLQFGGGGSSHLPTVHPRQVRSVFQSSFFARRLLRRADGSYLVPGAVMVSRPTGEGTGFSIGRFAVAALTPSFAPDLTFGGPATLPKLSIRLLRQRPPPRAPDTRSASIWAPLTWGWRA